MREILFRGLRVDGKGFAFGNLIRGKNIKDQPFWQIGYGKENYKIHPNTVGQYTGSLDKNGKKIFEGDKTYERYTDAMEENGYGECFYEISFLNGSLGWIGENSKEFYSLNEYPLSDTEIIGTIHDHLIAK